jgi:hypothetical protein
MFTNEYKIDFNDKRCSGLVGKTRGRVADDLVTQLDDPHVDVSWRCFRNLLR